MAYEQKNNQGSMFDNDKQGREQRPDLRGSIMVDGKEYWISAWRKATRDGKPWLSLSVQPKEARPQKIQEAEHRTPPSLPTDDDPFKDDLPF